MACKFFFPCVPVLVPVRATPLIFALSFFPRHFFTMSHQALLLLLSIADVGALRTPLSASRRAVLAGALALPASSRRAVADDSSDIEVYFGCGCFWHVQHEFVMAEKKLSDAADKITDLMEAAVQREAALLQELQLGRVVSGEAAVVSGRGQQWARVSTRRLGGYAESPRFGIACCLWAPRPQSTTPQSLK